MHHAFSSRVAADIERIGSHQNVTQTRKAVRIVMVTSYGLVRNAYAKGIPNQLTMDDLFD